MSLRLNIQDFEEELQPNALLASIQCGKGRKNLEHVHGLSTSSDSKATGEGKERRQTAFRINEAERIYVAVSQDSDMSILCHHALPGATSAGFPLTLPAQACVRFILRRYMPIFLINLQYFLGRTLFSIIQNEIK